MEQINIPQLVKDRTLLIRHLVLDAGMPKIEQLMEHENYDKGLTELVITLDGIEFTKEELNVVIKMFLDKALEHEKARLKFDDFDAAVKAEAKKMLSEKFGNLIHNLSEISSDLESAKAISESNFNYL